MSVPVIRHLQKDLVHCTCGRIVRDIKSSTKTEQGAKRESFRRFSYYNLQSNKVKNQAIYCSISGPQAFPISLTTLEGGRLKAPGLKKFHPDPGSSLCFRSSDYVDSRCSSRRRWRASRIWPARRCRIPCPSPPDRWTVWWGSASTLLHKDCTESLYNFPYTSRYRFEIVSLLVSLTYRLDSEDNGSRWTFKGSAGSFLSVSNHEAAATRH